MTTDATVQQGRPASEMTATSVPSGDQRGEPAWWPGNSGCGLLPSGFAVKAKVSPSVLAGSSRANAIRPFGPATFAPAGTAATAAGAVIAASDSASAMAVVIGCWVMLTSVVVGRSPVAIGCKVV